MFRIIIELANPAVQPGISSHLISIKVDTIPEGQMVLDEWFPPAEIGEWMPGVYKVTEKTMFRITIKNPSSRPVGCVVLGCGADFGIEYIFLPGGEPYYILG